MKINLDIINQFRPCKDRIDNYKKHNGTKTFSFDEFIDLNNITYEDKIWVARKVLNKNQLVHFGLLCAESVTHIFEEYPENKRVRDCITYLQTIKNFEDITQDQRNMILSHKQAADDAYAAADYATAAAYAAADYAAAADAAYVAKLDQQNLNLQFLKMAASL